MLKAFTRNYADNSTEAGFQFTFFCDICGDGYKSSFIESETYKKKSGLRALGRGAGILGSIVGQHNIGWNIERGSDVITERFEERSPEWQKEHEWAFNQAQNEAQQHFHRCHGCQQWVCDADYNEGEGLCIQCAPREDIAVAKAKSQAMQRNLDEAVDSQTVWKGTLESKTTVCPVCGKPAGAGKFCSSCGASMELNICPTCGNKVALGTRFCPECGSNMAEAAAPKSNKCTGCGADLEPGAKFCGSCGTKAGG